MQYSQEAMMRQAMGNFRPGGFGYFLLKLEQEGYVGKEDLALTLKSNPDRPLPPELLAYTVDFILGKVKKKHGRKPRHAAIDEFENFDAEAFYQRALRVCEYLAKRRKKALEARGKMTPKAEDAPHERASAITVKWINHRRAARGEKKIDPRTLLNRLSKHRKECAACSSAEKG